MRRLEPNRPPSNKKLKHILTHRHRLFREGTKLPPNLSLRLRKWYRPISLRSELGGLGS